MKFDESKYKKVLIETFRAFVDFCSENQLTYMAAGGTCIGAVRHHGMIPWDDDIDVFMPRADFNKLLSLKQELPKPYAIIQVPEHGYGTSFPKFYNTNTTLWEEKCLPVIVGVYVDIFPLDECADNREDCQKIKSEYDKAAYGFLRSMKHWSWNDILEKAYGLHPMGFLRLLTDKLYYSNRKHHFLESLKNIREFILKQKGNCVCSFDGAYGPKEVYDKQWFVDTVDTDFEGFKIKIPAGYDSYLTQNYHDYMQFPPVEKRQSTHSHFYINLEKGMTLDEVKAELGMK